LIAQSDAVETPTSRPNLHRDRLLERVRRPRLAVDARGVKFEGVVKSSPS